MSRLEKNAEIAGALRQFLVPIPADLLHEFYAYQLQHYRRFLLSVNLLGQAAYFSYGLVDALILPDVAWLAIGVRIFLLILTLPVVLALFRWSDNVRLLDLILPVLILVAAIAWFGILVRTTSSEVTVYLYASVIFIVLANLCVQVRFFAALVISLLISAVIFSGVYLLNDGQPEAVLLFALTYMPVLYFSLFISWSSTLHRRKEFLRSVLDDRTRQALARSVEQQEQMLAQLTRFSAMISHEFRNPLAIIASQLSLIDKERTRGVLNLRKRLAIMSSATRRLARLFDTWLQNDRLATIQSMCPRRLMLRPWLEQLIDGHRYVLADHVIALRFAPGVEAVFADEQFLEIAVSNVLENACKYSPRGTPILIEACAKTGMVGIAISDQGCGIAPEHQGEVFKPYYRVAADAGAQGLGLGLSAVQRIVRAHGGDVELVSTVCQGSRFCLWLPIGEDQIT
jgi:signal transduction histidine kinase